MACALDELHAFFVDDSARWAASSEPSCPCPAHWQRGARLQRGLATIDVDASKVNAFQMTSRSRCSTSCRSTRGALTVCCCSIMFSPTRRSATRWSSASALLALASGALTTFHLLAHWHASRSTGPSFRSSEILTILRRSATLVPWLSMPRDTLAVSSPVVLAVQKARTLYTPRPLRSS